MSSLPRGRREKILTVAKPIALPLHLAPASNYRPPPPHPAPPAQRPPPPQAPDPGTRGGPRPPPANEQLVLQPRVIQSLGRFVEQPLGPLAVRLAGDPFRNAPRHLTPRHRLARVGPTGTGPPATVTFMECSILHDALWHQWRWPTGPGWRGPDGLFRNRQCCRECEVVSAAALRPLVAGLLGGSRNLMGEDPHNEVIVPVTTDTGGFALTPFNIEPASP